MCAYLYRRKTWLLQPLMETVLCHCKFRSIWSVQAVVFFDILEAVDMAKLKLRAKVLVH